MFVTSFQSRSQTHSLVLSLTHYLITHAQIYYVKTNVICCRLLMHIIESTLRMMNCEYNGVGYFVITGTKTDDVITADDALVARKHISFALNRIS